MAVVNVTSQIIDDLDATPVVKVNQLEDGGKVRSSYGSADFAASDATSIARVLRIASDAKVVTLRFASDDLGTGGTVDVGLHQTTENGGAAVDDDLFASAVDTDTAAVGWTDITDESAVVAIEDAGKALWEQLGLSTDPRVNYDVTVTRNTAAGTGTVALKMEYVRGE